MKICGGGWKKRRKRRRNRRRKKRRGRNRQRRKRSFPFGDGVGKSLGSFLTADSSKSQNRERRRHLHQHSERALLYSIRRESWAKCYLWQKERERESAQWMTRVSCPHSAWKYSRIQGMPLTLWIWQQSMRHSWEKRREQKWERITASIGLGKVMWFTHRPDEQEAPSSQTPCRSSTLNPSHRLHFSQKSRCFR